jgi:hypothetical protein
MDVRNFKKLHFKNLQLYKFDILRIKFWFKHLIIKIIKQNFKVGFILEYLVTIEKSIFNSNLNW